MKAEMSCRMLHSNGSLISGSKRNSQLQISPAISCIPISCISRWQLCDKGSYTSEIRFGLDLLWQKWDQNLVSSFYTLETCQCLLDLCLDGDWPGRAGFKKKIKPIRSVSRKKKTTLLLADPYKKPPIFLSQKNPRKWFFILGETAEPTWKVLFPRIFLKGRCTSNPNDNRGLVCCAVPMLQRRKGCISPELQVNKPCPPAPFRSGWSVCPSVSAMVLLPMVRICQHSPCRIHWQSSFWLFH